MARSHQWGLIVALHWPICVYLSAVAYATIYDDQFDPGQGGIPAATQDDQDRALQVATFIIVVAAGFGTLTDLVDLVVSLWALNQAQSKRKISPPTASKDRADQTLSSRKPPSRIRYLIVILRFIMIVFWITVLVWGLVPTDVLMYIDYDPADGIEGGYYPVYSDTIITFISLLLVFDFISIIGPFIERCLLYFFWRKSKSQLNIGKADGHREIGSVGLAQLKSTGSIPIGHMLSVEELGSGGLAQNLYIIYRIRSYSPHWFRDIPTA